MALAKTAQGARDVTAELAFLTRALKAPTLRESVTRLAQRARAESWTHEEFLAACLQREVAARESHGGEGRIRAARYHHVINLLAIAQVSHSIDIRAAQAGTTPRRCDNAQAAHAGAELA